MECTIGGTRRHLGDVSRGLLLRGWDVHLAVSAERTAGFREDMAELARAGAVIHELPMVRAVSPWKDRAHTLELTTLMRELRPDVVHTHSSKAGVLGRRAASAAGCGAVVHTPHTYSFLFGQMFGPVARWVFKSVERRLSALAHRIIAVSEDEAETMRGAGVVSAEQVRVVPNCIEVEPYQRAAPVIPEGSAAERTHVLVCGLLNSAKGQDLAIAALKGSGCEQIELWLAGDGAEQAALLSLAAAMGVSERVRFLGHRDDVPGLMRAADLLLLPSRWEGMPYVVLEAAAAGLPIVATPVDGAREFLAGELRGWTAEASTEEAIGAALAAAASAGEAERALRSERAGQCVLDHHAVERMMDALEAVYAELL
jgi:glycosyltransferase involved in cell wall biosynthesis